MALVVKIVDATVPSGVAAWRSAFIAVELDGQCKATQCAWPGCAWAWNQEFIFHQPAGELFVWLRLVPSLFRGGGKVPYQQLKEGVTTPCHIKLESGIVLNLEITRIMPRLPHSNSMDSSLSGGSCRSCCSSRQSSQFTDEVASECGSTTSSEESEEALEDEDDDDEMLDVTEDFS